MGKAIRYLAKLLRDLWAAIFDPISNREPK